MNNLDKFYTKPEVAKACIDYLNQIIPISEDDILLEPSAGCGNFLKVLTNYNVVAYDLLPEGENIVQQDFLLLESEYKDYITIGNPPFGKRSKLAIQFFNKATTMSKVIGFIIPNSARICNSFFYHSQKLDRKERNVYNRGVDKKNGTVFRRRFVV